MTTWSLETMDVTKCWVASHQMLHQALTSATFSCFSKWKACSCWVGLTDIACVDLAARNVCAISNLMMVFFRCINIILDQRFPMLYALNRSWNASLCSHLECFRSNPLLCCTEANWSKSCHFLKTYGLTFNPPHPHSHSPNNPVNAISVAPKCIILFMFTSHYISFPSLFSKSTRQNFFTNTGGFLFLF